MPSEATELTFEHFLWLQQQRIKALSRVFSQSAAIRDPKPELKDPTWRKG
jgi:hypothetical protein